MQTVKWPLEDVGNSTTKKKKNWVELGDDWHQTYKVCSRIDLNSGDVVTSVATGGVVWNFTQSILSYRYNDKTTQYKEVYTSYK